MDRRRFLSWLGVSSGGLLMSGASAVPAEDPAMCRTPPRADALRLASADDGDLIIAGTRLFKEGFLDQLLPAYAQATGRKARMLGGGCDDGVAGVRLGSALLGGICCPIEDSPAAGLKGYTVANDMKVVVGHPALAVDQIPLTQIRPLLTGQLDNWRALGGLDQPITLVVYDHCPDYLEPVRRRFLDNRPIWSPQGMVVKTDQKHLDTIARFEGAVGINSWILVAPYVRQGRLKVLGIDGVRPTLDNAARGLYPLTGPLTLIFDRWREDALRPFFDFIYGIPGRLIVARRAIPVTASQGGYPRRANPVA